MYYNFSKIHQSLRVTPAMEAGVSDHVWNLEDIIAPLDSQADIFVVKYIPLPLSIIQIVFGFLVIWDANVTLENTGEEVMTEFCIGATVIVFGAFFLLIEILKKMRKAN